jgi:signal transduction histidine kinase
VCDDGIGFDTNLHYPGHLGLVSMRERAEKCGGSLNIGSHQGHGTAIRVQLPTDCACH